MNASIAQFIRIEIKVDLKVITRDQITGLAIKVSPWLVKFFTSVCFPVCGLCLYHG